MSATISAYYNIDFRVTETFSGAESANPDILINGPSETDTLTALSTVPGAKVAKFDLPLIAGAATIDLTALPGLTADETINFTGLKVQAAIFRNKVGNANNMTVVFGAANAYLLKGAAWKAILAPGQLDLFLGKDAAPDVDATHKNIDVAGTLVQVLEVFLIAG